MTTIVAISTAPAIGGIGIIRMSGEKCFEILDKIFKAKNPEKKVSGYKIKYGIIINSSNKRVIDEVLVSYFIAPKSYTTENMCEINSHGGMVVVKEILKECIKNGAVLAKPGEFTQRAFINGRIDLTQAESIIDIINAKSTKEVEASMRQLEGFLTREIGNIRKNIIELMADIEATIDYPEYDVEEVSYAKAKNILKDVQIKLERLKRSFINGKIIKEGIKVAIIGSPNAGKSSLLNEMIKEDKAIVTECEGTTRDIIEEQITIEGIPFIIVDTAGIRESEDKVEKIGIEKSKKMANESDLILAVFDNSKELDSKDKEILKIIKDKKAIILLNKTDLKDYSLEKNKEIRDSGKNIIKISLKDKKGTDEIYNELSKMFNLNEIKLDNEVVITNIRHQELIEKAIKHTEEAISTLGKKLPIDIIAINIKDILEDLGEITGDNVSEDIIKEIFSKFCLGK